MPVRWEERIKWQVISFFGRAGERAQTLTGQQGREPTAPGRQAFARKVQLLSSCGAAALPIVLSSAQRCIRREEQQSGVPPHSESVLLLEAVNPLHSRG